MLANARVYQGFAFHNACYEITRAMQSKFFPMRNRITFWPNPAFTTAQERGRWPVSNPVLDNNSASLPHWRERACAQYFMVYLDASLAAHFLKPHMLSICGLRG